MYAMSVAKPSPTPVPFINIKEFTLERNLMCVSSVEKPSLCPLTFKYM
jgi:hypothetical protein